jgi:VWFA-related protein
MTIDRMAAWLALFLGWAPQAEVRTPREAPPTAVFWAEVNYVEVDAVVTDSNGYTVRGLTRDDFEILEEGVPQEIASFTEIALPIETAPARPEASGAVEPPPSRQVATNEQELEGRIYVLVLDALHTHPRRSHSVRRMARRFVDDHMTDGDIAAVVHTDGRTDAAQNFTRDRSLLKESIEHFMGRKVESAVLERSRLLWKPPDMLLPFDPQRVADARTAMETLENVVRGIADVHGRRKAILFFSEGSSSDTLDTAHDSQRGEGVFVPMKARCPRPT